MKILALRCMGPPGGAFVAYTYVYAILPVLVGLRKGLEPLDMPRSGARSRPPAYAGGYIFSPLRPSQKRKRGDKRSHVPTQPSVGMTCKRYTPTRKVLPARDHASSHQSSSQGSHSTRPSRRADLCRQ